jgi:hypothetical protein
VKRFRVFYGAGLAAIKDANARSLDWRTKASKGEGAVCYLQSDRRRAQWNVTLLAPDGRC